MIMNHLKLSCLFLLGVTPIFAQNSGVLKCGSDNYYQQHLDNHPEIIDEREQRENYMASFAQTYNPEIKTSGITIPVVFHVNDPSNPQKVTMAQIQSALDILNEDFTATNAEITSIRPEFQNVIANLDINFCLASKDPNGNATSGVTYHLNSLNGREPSGYGTAVKEVEYWPGENYLNIWIVNETEDDGSLYNSGWAFLPDSWVANNNVDGIVFNHRYLGYTGSSDVSGPSSWQAEMARVLTHEVGHYLDLHHTFKNYCSSPGDYVDDTPYVYYHGSNNCDQLGTLCATTSLVMDQNYMDYTPCPSMYSLGQKTRVMAALNAPLAGRNNLWTNANLISSGCASNVGAENLSGLENIKIYPNPTTTELNIDFENTFSGPFTIRITNNLGQEVRTIHYENTTSQPDKFDISTLSNGIYIIAIVSSDSTIVKRLVKQE
ncbi:MAG: hypothetical protein ACJASQ_002272 [Crocinitomicaceae bacterium]|jgi:hypothetical protein